MKRALLVALSNLAFALCAPGIMLLVLPGLLGSWADDRIREIDAGWVTP